MRVRRMARQVPLDRPDAGFARLLTALDPDPDRAGYAYEHLRRALIRFFEWRDAHPADECADITLDRLERKLGEATPILDVHAFAYGIARLVMLERLRRPVALPLHDAGDVRAAEGLTSGDQGDADVRRCFDACLASLPQDSQALVLRSTIGRESTDRGAPRPRRRARPHRKRPSHPHPAPAGSAGRVPRNLSFWDCLTMPYAAETDRERRYLLRTLSDAEEERLERRVLRIARCARPDNGGRRGADRGVSRRSIAGD